MGKVEDDESKFRGGDIGEQGTDLGVAGKDIGERGRDCRGDRE